MRQLFRLGTCALFLACAISCSAAEGMPKDANTTCCVMQKEGANPGLYVDYKGQRIYVCCTKCKKRFANDPEKYLERLRAQDAATTTSGKAVSAAK